MAHPKKKIDERQGTEWVVNANLETLGPTTSQRYPLPLLTAIHRVRLEVPVPDVSGIVQDDKWQLPANLPQHLREKARHGFRVFRYVTSQLYYKFIPHEEVGRYKDQIMRPFIREKVLRTSPYNGRYIATLIPDRDEQLIELQASTEVLKTLTWDRTKTDTEKILRLTIRLRTSTMS